MTEKGFCSRVHYCIDEGITMPFDDPPEVRQQRHKAAVARLEKLARDAQIAAKVDRAAELIERITAMRNRPIPDAEDAGPNAWELAARYQPSAEEMARGASAEDQARICAESEAAYAARNPHKKRTVGGYEGEDAVAAPADRFADASVIPAGRTVDAVRQASFAARCRASEAAYAARNPHRKEYA